MKTLLIVLTALSMTGCASLGNIMRITGEVMSSQPRPKQTVTEKECVWCGGAGWVKCYEREYGAINGYRKCSNCKGTGVVKSGY